MAAAASVSTRLYIGPVSTLDIIDAVLLPWQVPAMDKVLREAMIRSIIDLTQVQNAWMQSLPGEALMQWLKRLPGIAQTLEEGLYRTAASKMHYMDKKTLTKRLEVQHNTLTSS